MEYLYGREVQPIYYGYKMNRRNRRGWNDEEVEEEEVMFMMDDGIAEAAPMMARAQAAPMRAAGGGGAAERNIMFKGAEVDEAAEEEVAIDVVEGDGDGAEDVDKLETGEDAEDFIHNAEDISRF